MENHLIRSTRKLICFFKLSTYPKNYGTCKPQVLRSETLIKVTSINHQPKCKLAPYGVLNK